MSDLRQFIKTTDFDDETVGAVLLDLADELEQLRNRVAHLERYIQYGPERVMVPPVPDGADLSSEAPAKEDDTGKL